MLAAFLVWTAAAGASDVRRTGVLALGGLDPVALVAGIETPGDPTITLDHGSYRYRFADQVSRDQFQTHPDRYALQMGGACARMGPRSGLGSPDRYLVHEGRIYVFASDACRDTFENAPARYIDRDDPELSASAESRARALALLEKAAEAMGGTGRIDSLKAIQIRRNLVYGTGDDAVRGRQITTMSFPGQYRDEQLWPDDWHSVEVACRDHGFRSERGTWWPLDPAVLASTLIDLERMPLVMVRDRTLADVEIAHAGSRRLNEQHLEAVAVRRKGRTTTLWIDSTSGRIVQATYRGRVGMGAIGDVVETYGDFRTVDGLVLPFQVQRTFDGKAVQEANAAIDAITLNPILDDRTFATPDN